MSDKQHTPQDNHPTGEAQNTSAMKLVKSDGELFLEARQLTNALVDKMQELRNRAFIVEIGLDNGFQDGKVQLLTFSITHHQQRVSFVSEEATKRMGPQGQQPGVRR